MFSLPTRTEVTELRAGTSVGMEGYREPQQLNVWLLLITQPPAVPVDIDMASDMPATDTGTFELPPFWALPRVPDGPPSPFEPQHFTSPVDNNAHAKGAPTSTAVAFEMPITATGEEDFVDVQFEEDPVPAPSIPQSFDPQHETEPDERTAQVFLT